MTNEGDKSGEISLPPVFVVSGGLGSTGEQLVNTSLAQFQDIFVPVKIFPKTHYVHQLEDVVEEAVKNGATIVHTLADPKMRESLIRLCREKNVEQFDIVGPFLNHIATLTGQTPIGKPGLYQQHLYPSYFKRVEAIDFTLAHDDGMNYQEWDQAEIVLVGVSRVGKTPLSLYLSILGWKVANVPLVTGIPPRPQLYELDGRRIVGLTIDPGRLLRHRQHRQRGLGVSHRSDYASLEKIYEEIEAARRLMRRAGFRIINVTDKPIESTADDVLSLVTRRLENEPDPS